MNDKTHPQLSITAYRSHWATDPAHSHDSGLIVMLEIQPDDEERQGIELGRAKWTREGLNPSQQLRTWGKATAQHSRKHGPTA